MATIASAPFNFTAAFSVGEDDYTAHVNQIEFAPSQPTSTWTDVSGKVYNFGGQSGYVLNLAGAQDWETANSLSSFLFAHDGEEATVSVTVPGGTWEATVILAAPPIGGTVNSVAAFSVTLQVIGKPDFTADEA